jgi:hypothetical protein
MSYVDLGKDGPLVFEAPPQLQGILLDFWQRPIPVDGGKFFGDVGFAGPDAGKGGKFLLLPPGYKGAVPKGYYVYRSATNNVFIFLRSFYQDPKNLMPAVALVEQSKIYPLNGKAGAKPMTFPDASGVPATSISRSSCRAAGRFARSSPAACERGEPSGAPSTAPTAVASCWTWCSSLVRHSHFRILGMVDDQSCGDLLR